MLFSIITVTRNNIKGLKATAQSVLAQDCDDYEWWVIDGASDDASPEWLTGQSEAHWISEPDQGIYDAMNKGIERAQGAYLIFMNAGDQFADPHVLAHIKARLDACEDRPDFIYGDSLEAGSGETAWLKPAKSHEKYRLGMFTHHQAMLYARKTLGAIRYDTRYKIAADYDLTVRFLQKAETALKIDRTICLFESGGISQQNAKLGRAEQADIRQNLKLLPQWRIFLLLRFQAALWHFRMRHSALYRWLRFQLK